MALGGAGLAYGASIMPVKVLDDNGSGSFVDIAAGVYWAVDNGADVINMSLGTNAKFGVRSDPIMDPALDYAAAMGVVVVCASGNDGHRKNVSYPAIHEDTIAVGATDFVNGVTRYSNKGEGLTMVAPGGDLGRDRNGDGFGDGVLQETRIGGSFGYYFFEGTSMASPHVAAAAAMLIAEDPLLTPDGVLVALTSTALDLRDSGYDSASGYGLLQVADALNGSPPPPPPCTDNDGDRWCVEEGDLDDADPSSYPGAPEICGDNKDNNYDGNIDERCGEGPTSVRASSISYSSSGGRSGDKHVFIYVDVVNDQGGSVSGASVDVTVSINGVPTTSGTATTNSTGTALFEWKNAPSGSYTTTVDDIVAALPWAQGADPDQDAFSK